MLKSITLGCFLYCLGTVTVCDAAIIPYSSTFSSNVAGWTSVGSVATVINRNASSIDGAAAGDLVAGDGALVMDTVDSIAGNEAMAYTLTGTPDLGDLITISYGHFNGNASFNSQVFQLYNFTDSTVLASQGFSANGNTAVADLSFSYTATLSDIGDTLQLRIVENHNNSARNTWIDNISMTVTPVPEPSLALLGGAALLGMAFARGRGRD